VFFSRRINAGSRRCDRSWISDQHAQSQAAFRGNTQLGEAQPNLGRNLDGIRWLVSPQQPVQGHCVHNVTPIGRSERLSDGIGAYRFVQLHSLLRPFNADWQLGPAPLTVNL
jgi:hypothetical protein